MEQARAYELGTNVSRDYHAAAEIYRTACNDGHGDVEACGALIRAGLRGRGTDLDKLALQPFAAKICVARRDPFTCVMADLLSPSEAALPAPVMTAIKEVLQTLPPCDATHISACWASLVAGSLGGSDSSSAETRREEQNHHVCTLGIIEGCASLVSYSRDRDAKDVADARQRLLASCDAGDADACEPIGRPIEAAKLCAAHDYNTCGLLGCAGDEAAAELASAHRVDVRCDQDLSRAGISKPVAPGISPTPRPPFDSVEFHPLGAPSQNGMPHFEIYNTGTRTIVLLLGAIYAYDAAGHQVARNAFELRNVSLAPSAGTTLVVRGVGGESFESCVDLIEFDDDRGHVHLGRCPAHKAKGARWGDGRDNVELLVSLPGIPLADDWTGTLEPALAEPFEQSHPGIRVRAIGSDAVSVFLAPSSFTAAQLAQLTKTVGPVIELPLVREPTTIAYHVTGVRDLQLSPTTLARIFQHQIIRWNDPALAKDNPKLALPSAAIVVLQDEGGADEQRLTGYLTSTARGTWRLGVSKDVAFFEGVQRVRSYDLAQTVGATEGAITYLGPGVADAAGLPVARLRNARGAFVAPSPRAVASGDYSPASSRSLYVVAAPTDQATADAARAYATWLLTDGQAIFEQLGYGRQPESVARAALARLGGITVAKPTK